MSTIDALIDWLIDGAPGAPLPEDVVARIGDDLCAAGVKVGRITAFFTTLHPTMLGLTLRWESGKPAGARELPHGLFDTAAFLASPIRHVLATKTEQRFRIAGPGPHPHPILDELAQAGFLDYFVHPIVFTTGEPHAISFATAAPAGFSDGDLEILRRVCRPLARVLEIMVLRRVATTLLSTYVGRNSGERILRGRIQRGDFETLRAVIWFSDLRGFTEMSSRGSPREVIDTLNRVFECQVPAIEKHGGEVLKFIGDGLLAIFPLGDGDAGTGVGDAALAAADEALAAIAALAPLRIGLALHVGELAYGNIGSSHRLDFTAIGPAVNIASRLEGLTSKLARPLVVSEDFARLTTRATEEIGTFELKGVPAPVRVFAPRA